MKNARKACLTLLALGMVGLLGAACTPQTVIGAGGYAIYKKHFAPDDINLTEKNYAAADYLTQQASTYIARGDVIKARSLTILGTPELTSQLARMIPAQVGTRLAQLGYNMDLSEVAEDADQTMYQTVNRKQTPDHSLTGTYRRAKNDLQITMRIVEAANNRVIGAFEYHVPYSRELRKLAEPEARIFVVDEP